MSAVSHETATAAASGPRKPYVRPISKTSWFMTSARYKAYMVHEVSSIFVALYMIQLVVGLFSLASGPEAWDGYLAFLRTPFVIFLTLVGLVFFVIHTTSWFKAVPQATRIMRGEEILPGKILIAAHYAIWAAVSLFVIILAWVA